MVTVHRFRVQGSGLGEKLKLHPKKALNNVGFATSLLSAMFQDCEYVKAVVLTYKTLTKWLKVIRIQPLNP